MIYVICSKLWGENLQCRTTQNGLSEQHTPHL